MSQCIALQYPVFQPAMRLITAITNSFPVVITTSFEHQYISGTIIRLDIPPADGMQQADQFVGPITVTSPTTFTMVLDTTTFTPFEIPAPTEDNFHIFTCAQAVPIAENNDILTAAVQNVLPYNAT
jgi:hypothetical protein